MDEKTASASSPLASKTGSVPQIPWQELKTGALIGNGSYGDVYMDPPAV